ncbi:MAG: formimidoylglutamate deiminase [Pseudomonadota bacterium]
MTTIFADEALLPGGFAKNIRVTLRGDGRIDRVVHGREAPGDLRVSTLLPAPINLHSHAFQRAMAGLTERRGRERDTFWTWRALMFDFLDRLTPDDVEAIAALVQVEMLEAGFGGLAEFHYLHHQPGGAPYAALSEMSARVVAAAEVSGIGLTLLPVHYAVGGCDGRPLAPGQVRFGNDLDRFAALYAEAENAVAALPDGAIGLAPHSLRAVPRGDFDGLIRLTKGPIHMHLAEQGPEVDEVLAAWGARPVTWALDHLPINQRWCLIHTTQMTPDETTALAATGAVSGLCPITESSLGDGIFDGARFLEAGGRFGVGSDSNVRISLAEELRTLEYSQRLRDRGRAVLASADRSTGRVLFEGAVAGGAQAAGRETGVIAQGALADLLALDGTHIDLDGRSGDRVLDAFVFCGDQTMVNHVWSGGRHVVDGGRHVAREAVVARYRAVMARLLADL